MAARVVSALLAGAAVWAAGSALLPKAPDPGVPTLVTARDLPLGATLAGDDVLVDGRPSASVPQGALSDPALAVGQVLGGPVLAGEILTRARFRGPGGLTALPAGTLAVSVPVGDAALAATLRPADLVSVLVMGSGETVAASAAVLATDAPGAGVLSGSGLGGPGPGGAHVVLALSPAEARAVAVALGATTTGGFLIALHR